MKALLAAVLLGVSAHAVGQANAPANAAANDVAVVNQLAGEAAFFPSASSSSQPSGKVTPYMRVREGDRVSVPAGSQLRLVFFGTGRQETWVGPGSFRAAKGSAQPLSGTPAQLVTLPASAPPRLARVPELLQNAKLGGIQVRSAPAAKSAAGAQRETAVREARAAYEEMRGVFPPTDITPELFLYAALSEHSLYDDMRPVVQEMLRKQPRNGDAASLAAWLKTRTGK